MQIINTTDVDVIVGHRTCRAARVVAYVHVELEADHHLTHSLMVGVVQVKSAEVKNLPDPMPDTVYLVTREVLDELGGTRPDCFALLPGGRLLGGKGA